MKEYSKAVREILSKNGCYFVRHGKGDHDIWHCPTTNRNVTVDGTIPSRHMANEVLKQAGLKKQF
ncbi:MAG: type II toxin-antitoxin system HicA family toxin [Oscillospiraceae bacterium]|nr:type II toxin-antitoxin system HicA family toxin [Oscillospiraceae bacterium]